LSHRLMTQNLFYGVRMWEEKTYQTFEQVILAVKSSN
jgi:hypothetical protein